ncbi:MAG: hypothetical protein GX640_03060, partial [Fibrobacter sp.]|nr:hypothetical protein [Fibrobacter sp.]
MTSYTGDDGYVPVSRTVGVIGDPVNDGRDVTITMPVSQNSLPGDYAVMQTGDVGPVLLAAEPSDGGITFKLSKAADFTIVKKVKRVTGYFDNGIVYSNEKVSRVTLDIAITDCKTTATNPGTAVLTYTDYSDPQNPEVIPQTIDLIQKGDGLVTGTGDFMSKKIGGAIEVTALEIKIPSDNLDAKTTCSYMVKPGQWFKVSAGKTEAAYNNAQTAVPDKYVFSYVGTNLGFESASLNGEGVARKNPGAVNDVFRYSYFYKDHLGTTRMVVNEDNGIAEAMMYQAYGTYSDVFNATSADPLREKFTGKEFDEEGAVTESEITLDIKITGIPNTDGYSNVLTVTCQNMVTGNDVVKSWFFDRDETSLWLYRNDRFPDKMKLKKIEIKAIGTSQTIDYSKSDFNIQVDCGKKLTVALNKSAQDIITNNSANHFTVTGPEVVTDQVAGLGLYYFGARYLDAEIGTWLSRDAVEQYMNSYMYSGCNPINLIDPNGLQDVYINRDDKPFIYEWPETIDLGLNINTIYIDDYSTFTNMGLSLNMDYLNSTVFDISSFNDFQYSSIMAYNSEFY